MTFELYDWQEQAVASVLFHLESRPILVAPCGGGKTAMAVEAIRALGLSTVFVAHRQELIDQTGEHLRRVGEDPGFIVPGERLDRSKKIQVASKDTLVRRALPFDPELLVFDECHHAVEGSGWKTVLDNYPSARLFGLTATPFRLDGKPLGALFGKLVVGAWFDDLVADGRLVDPTVYAPEKPNLDGVAVRAGEYRREDAEAVMDTSMIVGNAVKTWLERGRGRRTLCYATTVKHSLHVVEEFRKAGVRATHVDGTTPKDERRRIVRDLETHSLDLVSNVDVFTEGTDIPAIEVAVILRPTYSLNRHIQICGRAARACEGKEGAIILDHAGNSLRHGLLSQRFLYSLDGKVKPSADGGVEPKKPRACRACGLVIPAVPLESCPGCGAKLGRGEVLQVPGELVDFQTMRVRAPFAIRKRYWDDMEAIRTSKNPPYAEGWPWWRYVARFKEKPVLAGRRLVDETNASREDKRAVWKDLDAYRKLRGYKPGWTYHSYRRIFNEDP